MPSMIGLVQFDCLRQRHTRFYGLPDPYLVTSFLRIDVILEVLLKILISYIRCKLQLTRIVVYNLVEAPLFKSFRF